MEIKITKKDNILFKYIWLIIILPKEIQLIVFAVLLIYLVNNKKFKIDFQSGILFLYTIVHLISIGINYFTGSYSNSRVFAAFNTAMIWIVAVFYYNYYKNNKINIKDISKIAFSNLFILIGILILSLGIFSIGIKSVSIMGVKLHSVDWYNNNPIFRLAAFMDYPNLIVMFFLLQYPFSLLYLENKKSIVKYIWMGMWLLPIYFSRSRSGYIIVSLALIIIIFSYLKNIKNKKIIYGLYFMCVLFCIMFIYFDGFELINKFVNSLLLSREGSNTTRMKLYVESINKVNMISPLLGVGIKEYMGNFPLGSHSTYIGVYYKTGVLGSLFWIIGMSGLIIKLIKLNRLNTKSLTKREVIISLIAILGMCIFEDLDGSNWLIVLYFSCMGIVMNNKNNWNFRKKLMR